MNNIDKWLSDMFDKGLASTTTASSWIQRAVEQRNDRLTVSLASSVLLTYNDLDIVLLQRQILN